MTITQESQAVRAGVTAVGEVELAWQLQGSGPPLVLISGLGQSALPWTAVLPRLTSHFTCLTFDNRGTGRSSVPEGPYPVDDMADDVAGLVTALDLGPVSAVGWSLGGSVLQSMLIRHGEILERAVLLSAFPSYTSLQHAWLDNALTVRRAGLNSVDAALASMAWSWTPRVTADHRTAVEQAQLVLADPYPTSLAGFEAQAAGLRVYDSRPDLPQIETPTLVLVGAEDVLTPAEQSVQLAELIPHSRLRVLPRGGHAMVLEYPEDTIAAITSWLAREDM